MARLDAISGAPIPKADHRYKSGRKSSRLDGSAQAAWTLLFPPGRNEISTNEAAVKCVQCGADTELYRADVTYCVGCMVRSDEDRQKNSFTSLLETDKRSFKQDKKS